MRLLRFFSCIFLVLAGCGRHPTTADRDQVMPAAGQKVDACSLLSKTEIGAVQQATMSDGSASESPFLGDFVSSQCVYPSAEPDRSVALLVIQRDPARASQRSIKQYWDDAFERLESPKTADKDSREDEEKEERERKERAQNQNQKATPPSEEEEEKAHQRAIKVPGLGDEAYWSGPAHIGGILYVREGEKILRVSVGGPGTDDERLAKSKALAAKALAHFPK